MFFFSNNKPTFPECDRYSNIAKIKEGRHLDPSVSVVNVTAVDYDSGQNGQIIYSLYYPKGETRKPFMIDAHTGELKPSPYEEFDREERPFEDVTVKAQDLGERPLIGFCHFTVQLLDVNDNKPDFDRASYETTISRSTPVGKSVITVYADDKDAPENAKIRYGLQQDPSLPLEHANDHSYFRVNEASGEIILDKRMPPEKSQFKFLVVANDSGNPPLESSAQVVLEIADGDQPFPIWQPVEGCQGTVRKPENLQINSILFKCCATPGGSNERSPVQYSLRNGAKPAKNSNGDFRVFLEKEERYDCAIVRNMKALDYEKVKRYELTLSATDLRSGASVDKELTVELTDENDCVPRFQVRF